MKKKTCGLRVISVLMAVLLLCMQLLPVGAVTSEEEDDALTLYSGLVTMYGTMGDIFSSNGGPETFPFTGTVTSDNIDRVAAAAVMLGYAFEPEKYGPYVETESTVLELPGDLLKTAIKTYFSAPDVDLSLSKHYVAKSKSYIVDGEEANPGFPFWMLSQQLTFRSSEDAATGKVTLDGIYLGADRLATGRLCFELIPRGTVFAVASVSLQQGELLTLREPGTLTIENYTHYLRGARAGMKAEALQGVFDGSGKQVAVYSSYYEETSAATPVGTGTGICLLDESGDIVDYLELVMLGDVNGDGLLTSTDYLQIKGYFASRFSLEGSALEAADVDGNGIITTADYLRLRAHMANRMDIYA